MARHNILASIAPSKDTIFVRGFSARQHIDNIREFFVRGGARNSVEFFKADENQLFLALRFETKDIAKDVLERYDNKEILGDRVTMSYYKDLRRANFRRPMGQRDEYEYNRYDARDRRNDYGGGWRGGDSYNRQRSGGMWSGGGHYQQHQAVASRIRRYTRSSSHSRSQSQSRTNSRSSSSSAAPSPSRRKHRHRSTSGGRRNKSPKRKSGRSKRRTEQSSQSPDRLSSQASERRKSKGRKVSTGGDGTEDQSPGAEWRAGAGDTSAALSESNAEEERKKIRESSADGGTVVSDINEAEGEKSAAVLRGQRSSAATADKKRKVTVTRTADDDKQDENDDDDIISHNTGKLPKSRKQSKDGSRRQADVDDEHSGDNDDDNSEDDKILAANKGPQRKSKNDEHEALSRGLKPLSGKEGLYNEEAGGGGDGRSGVKRKKPLVSGQSDVEPSDQEIDEDLEQQLSARKRKKADQSTARGLGRRGHPADITNGREIERNAQTLSQQKLALIREKKDEIEKAYRQDCETFATVSKMLISKDQDLEDKIQRSLSENLKDIGQRCIQELREFVERLKADDDLI